MKIANPATRLRLCFAKAKWINRGRCFLLPLLCLQVFFTQAQPNITRVEYYVDTDPGFGNATALTISAAANIQDAIISINPASLSEGVHRLHVRAKDANGAWSLTNTWLFYKPYGNTTVPSLLPPGNITHVEYYIDNDPGIGSATSVVISPDIDVQDVIFGLDPRVLTEGVHRLYVRARDANGSWSLTNSLIFYKPYSLGGIPSLPPPAAISKIEYYLDDDPGIDSATSVSFAAGTDLQDIVIAINPTALTEGVHRMYVRAKDANGKWSLTNTLLFYKPYSLGGVPTLQPVPNLTKVEYYIDTDPGLDNATAITIAPGTNIQDAVIAIDPASLAEGVHRLYVRAKDANGAWSLTNTHLFYKPVSVAGVPPLLPLENISRVEYYLDTDPGVGNATALTISPDTNIRNAVIAIDPTSLTEGVHRLNVRAKDVSGKWSLTNTLLFYKPYNIGGVPVLQPVPELSRIEYYVDTDPGYGNGINVPINSNIPLTEVGDLIIPVNTNGLTFTNHILFVRARDANGAWSLVNKWNFRVEPPAAIYATVGILPDSICAGSAFRIPYIVNTSFGTGNIFTAQLSDRNGSFVTPVTIGTKTSSVSDTINAIIPANTLKGNGYLVRINSTNPDDTSNTSATTIKVLRKPELNFTITGDNSVCPGSKTYSASAVDPDASYRWQLSGGGTLTASGPNATINWTDVGTFLITLSDSNSCGIGLVRTLSVTVSSATPVSAPVLTNTGRTLYASALPTGASGYRWFRNGGLISGVTGSSFYAPLAGTYTVKFYTNCGDGPESNVIQFTNDLLTQSITFPAIANKTFGDSSFILNATASSGLPVIYRVVYGPVTLRGDTVIINGAGTASIEATQPGTINYQPATAVTRNFTIAKASQVVTFDSIPNKTYGQAAFQMFASSSTGLPVYYTVISGFAGVSSNYLYLNGAGSITVRAVQQGNQNYLTAFAERTFCVKPVVPGAIAGFRNACANTPSVYSFQPVNGIIYNWSLSGGGTLSATTGNTVTVNWTTNGTWLLTIKAAVGCDTTTADTTINISVTNPISPAAPTNLFPVNGAVVGQIPFTLSWMPAQNADLYDLYVWPAAVSQPTTPLAANLTQIGYTINSSQLPGLTPGAIYKWKVVSKNACRDASSVINTFSIPNIPDLVVQNVQTPASAFSGQIMSFSFDVKNIGLGGTGTSSWIDYAYLSRDTILHVNSGDVLLDTRQNISTLNANQTYTRSMTVQLPDSTTGTYYVLVLTNGLDPSIAPNAPSGSFGEVSLKNNLAYKTFQINLTPPPDLQVASVVCQSDAFSGQSIPVQFKITNGGSGDTKNISWKDYIYISPDPVLNINSAIKLTEVTHTGTLKKDSSYNVSTFVTLPNYTFGDYYLFAVTDAQNKVYEFTFENNNTGHSDTLNVFLTPTADFIPMAIDAPAVAVRGETIRVNWTVKNEGANKPTNTERNWNDAVYISRQPVFNTNSAIYLGSHYPNPYPVMNNGESYSAGQNITIPAGFEGLAYIYVLTDQTNRIFEFNGENNNIIRDSIRINIPDLEVTQITVPATASSAGTLSYSWKIKNNGPGKLANIPRYDNVWLSPTTVYNPATGINLASGSYYNALDSGGSITIDRTFTLPQTISGTYYVLVQTNANNNIAETNFLNNALVSSPVIISLTPSPDLRPDSIALSSTVVSPESKMGITYRVKNTGPVDIIGKAWTDKVYLSKQATWNPSASILVKSLPRVASIATGDSYLVNDSLQFTNQMLSALQAYAATCYVYVFTDADLNIYEAANEGNNTLRSSALTAIQVWRPDLAVTAIAGSDSALAGGPANVAWSVTNYSGTTTNYSNLWYDGVYLSRDTIWDNNDLFITDKVIYGPLAKDSAYSSQFGFTVPNGASGHYYMLLVADHKDLQNDMIPGNNYKLIRGAGNIPKTFYVTMPPPSDLTITNFQAASPGYAGQPITMQWTVKNIGPGLTNQANWTDRVYLSNSTQVTNSSQSLYSVARNGRLNADSSYTVSVSVVLPVSSAGNYYLVLRTDENNAVYEHLAESNNIAFSFINIIQPPPADLVTDSISAPAQVLTGDSITVSWLLQNIGQNPASGLFTEGVYLSKDSIYDNADVLLEDTSRTILLAASASITHSKKVKIKGNIVPGNYYVIVRTDLRNNFIESNELNNISTSVNTIQVDVRELPLNVIVAAPLQNSNEIYYKVVVPDTLVGEALLISLQSDSLRAGNELYVSHANLPTRIVHDLAFDKPFSPSQDIVVPSLDSGNYYIMAYGTVPTQQQVIRLSAKKINFEVREVMAKEGGNTGAVTVKISGAKFETGMLAQLTDPVLGTITAHTVYFINSTTVYASFNLAGKAIGIYDVKLTKTNATTALLADGFRIKAGSGGSIAGGGNNGGGFYCSIRNVGVEELLGVNVEYPPQTRTRRVFPMTINFGNSGNVDITAPVRILVSLSGDPLSFTAAGVVEDKKELILEFKELNGPPGILRPGATGSIVVYTQSTSNKNLVFKIIE